MRRFLGLMLLSALSLPALAADPPKVKAPHQHHPRMTWEAHFAQANLAHDGHLTLAEAKGGDNLVAKHFDEIDVTHRGYVTEDDIRAWREQHKTAHRHRSTRSAKHHATTQETAVAATPTAGGAATVVMPSNPPAAPGDIADGATHKN